MKIIVRQFGYEIMKQEEIIYLDLFAGIGGFPLAVEEVFPNAKCAAFSEIALAPLMVYQRHFSKHKNIGDIAKIVWKHDKYGNMLFDKKDKPILNKKALDKLPYFNCVFSGSPCQGLSRANITRKGLEDERSKLFYAFLEILYYKKPKYFLMENVASMSNKVKDLISELLGVKPVRIDSGLVSAAHRDRLYWCNWKIKQPKNRHIEWKGIKQNRTTRRFLCKPKEQDFLSELVIGAGTMNCSIGYKKSSMYAYSRSIRDIFKKEDDEFVRDKNGKKIKVGTYDERRFRKDGKLNTLVTSNGCGGSHAKNFVHTKWGWRVLTPIECARAQTFPDNWCKGMTDKEAYLSYGNAVTKDIVVHILKCHPLYKKKKKGFVNGC